MHQAIFRLCAWCKIGVDDLWLYDPVDARFPRGGTGCCEAAQIGQQRSYMRWNPRTDASSVKKMMCSILRWRINRPIQEFVKPLKQTLPRPCTLSDLFSVGSVKVQHSVRYHVKGLFVGDCEILVGTGASIVWLYMYKTRFWNWFCNTEGIFCCSCEIFTRAQFQGKLKWARGDGVMQGTGCKFLNWRMFALVLTPEIHQRLGISPGTPNSGISLLKRKQ